MLKVTILARERKSYYQVVVVDARTPAEAQGIVRRYLASIGHEFVEVDDESIKSVSLDSVSLPRVDGAPHGIVAASGRIWFDDPK